MKRTSVRAVLLCLAAVAILALAAVPAQAVIGGQHDSTGLYPNVGLVLEQDSDGNRLFGSGTLVDDDVVVTAMHCVVDSYDLDNPTYLAPGMRIRVSFDPDADPFNPENGVVWYEGVQVDVPATTLPPADAPLPNWVSWIGPGRDDIGVIKLATSPGITPATVVDADALIGADLKAESFAIVGYGISDIIRGNLPAWRSPQLQVLFDGRNYRDDISVVSENQLYSDRYLMVSAGNRPGDSGSPLLAGGTVIGECVTGQGAPTYFFRLDNPTGHALLEKWLTPDRFVTLP